MRDRIVARYKLAGFIPDKFWKDYTNELKTILSMPIDNPRDVVWGIEEKLQPFFSLFKDRLSHYGLNRHAEDSVKYRIAMLFEGQLSGIAERYSKLQSELNISERDSALGEILITLEMTIGDVFKKSAPTLGKALKVVYGVLPGNVLALAERLLKRATPEEVMALEQIAAGDYATRLLETKYKFLQRVNAEGLAKRLITKEKIDRDLSKWFIELKETLAANYGPQDIARGFDEFSIGNLKAIILDPNITIRNASWYAKRLVTANTLLKQKGFGKLWYGVLFVTSRDYKKIEGEALNAYKELGYETLENQAGTYHSGEDIVKITAPSDEDLTRVVIHEMGHRYWYKFMSSEQRARFNALVKTNPSKKVRDYPSGPTDDEGFAKPVTPVSDYGASTIEEAFAEVFERYVNEKDINRDQLESFRSVLASDRLADRLDQFFGKHPKLKRSAPRRIIEKNGQGSSGHGEARQHGDEIWIYSKFWDLDEAAQDFVLAHEIGHYVLSQYGLQKFIEVAQAAGLDPWDTNSLPFGQFNVDEAFADMFASLHLEPGELGRRYPKWLPVMQQMKTARTIPMDKTSVMRFTEYLEKQLAEIASKHDGPFGSKVLGQWPYELRAVDGETLSTYVRFVTVPSRETGFVLDGGVGFLRGKPIVVVQINGSLDADAIRKGAETHIVKLQLYNLLIHEFTHVADKYSRGVGEDLTEDEARNNPAAYYNSPSELRAYMQEVVDQVSQRFVHYEKLEKRFGQKALGMLLNMSDTWGKVSPYWTDQNKQKVLKSVYQALEDWKQSKTASGRVVLRYRWARLHKRATYDDHTLEILLAGIGILMAQSVVVTNSFFDEKEIRKFLSIRRQFHGTFTQACNDLADAFEQGEYGQAAQRAVAPLRAIAQLSPKQDRQALRQLTKLLRVLYPVRSEITGDIRIQRLLAFAKRLNTLDQTAGDRSFSDYFEQALRMTVLPAPLRTMFRKIVKLRGYTKLNETANPGAWFEMTPDQQQQIRETAERLTKEQDEAFEKYKNEPERRTEVYQRTSDQLQKLQNAAGVNLQLISKKSEQPLDTILKQEGKLQADGPTEYTAGKINSQLAQYGMRDRKEKDGLPREFGKLQTQISKARTYDTMARIIREAVDRKILPEYMNESIAEDLKLAGKNRAVREGRQLVPLQWAPVTPEEFKKAHDTGEVELPEGVSEKEGHEMLGRISRALSDLEGIFGKGFCGKHAKKLAFRLGGKTSSTARASYFGWDNKNEWQPRVTFGEDYEGLLAHELSHYFEDLLSFKLGPLSGKDRNPDWKPPYANYVGSGSIFGNNGVPMDRVVNNPVFESTRKELNKFIPEALEFAQAVVNTPDYKRWQDKVGFALESSMTEAVQQLTGQNYYDLPKDHPYAKVLDIRYKSELPPELLAKSEEIYKKWSGGDDRKLTYYESAPEVWARMCEQYVYTKLSKAGIANPWLTQLTYDTDVMDQFMEEETFDEVLMPVMDRLFESLGVRNFIARRRLIAKFLLSQAVA